QRRYLRLQDHTTYGPLASLVTTRHCSCFRTATGPSVLRRVSLRKTACVIRTMPLKSWTMLWSWTQTALPPSVTEQDC
ncbi:hypothetical protein GGI09_008789, partial [Coemansia sp. S100]